MAMGANLDLGSSISIHPHPFHLDSYRSSSPSGVHQHHAISGPDNPLGSSTSIESTTRPEPNANQVSVSRHVSLTIPPEDHHNPQGDIEDQRPLRVTSENDPYQLSSGLKTSREVDQLRPHPSSKRNHFLRPSLATRSGRQAKRLQEFYIAQNENIERLLKPVDEHRHDARVEHSGHHVKYQIAIHGSFAANVVLAGLQLYAAASSGSLSLFTTMADAIFDPLSNITLILSHRAVNRVDPRKFPSGKARIETAGNIVFCFIMCSLSFIIIVFSVRELAEGSHHEIKKFHLPSVIAVAIAFVTKFSLFLYCWALRNTYSQIRILWQDHRNDIVINGFGLMTSIGGSRLRWWIDPAGAIVLSVLVVVLWLRTAYKEFQLLIGVTANVQFQQLITYVCKYPFSFSRIHSLFICFIHPTLLVYTISSYSISCQPIEQSPSHPFQLNSFHLISFRVILCYSIPMPLQSLSYLIHPMDSIPSRKPPVSNSILVPSGHPIPYHYL